MRMNDVIWLTTAFFAFFLIFPQATSGSDFRAGQSLVITRDQIIDDDIYFAGNSITVDGVINGDLIAAGSDIVVSGIINGSLMAAAGTIILNGKITNDVRAAGGTVQINGEVGDNVLIFGGNLVTGKDTRIGRDLTMGAGSASIDGTVQGSLNGGASTMEMKGWVIGNATLDIDNDMKVLPGARVDGNLEYTAPKPAEISGTVAGETTFREKPKENVVSGIADELLGYLWLLLTGVLFLVFAPELSQKISLNVSINPLKNLLWGVLFLIVTPLFALILLVTIIAIPVSLILLAGYVIGIYISRIFVGLWIGRYMLDRLKIRTRYRTVTLASGLLILVIGINLPLLGIFLHLIVILLGLGSLVLTTYGRYRTLTEQKSV